MSVNDRMRTPFYLLFHTGYPAISKDPWEVAETKSTKIPLFNDQLREGLG